MEELKLSMTLTVGIEFMSLISKSADYFSICSKIIVQILSQGEQNGSVVVCAHNMGILSTL